MGKIHGVREDVFGTTRYLDASTIVVVAMSRSFPDEFLQLTPRRRAEHQPQAPSHSLRVARH
jgi:hypothetical protein